MKSLGSVKTVADLVTLTSGLEFVEAKATGNDLLTASFVRYAPGSRSGRFHHYVSIEIPLTVFKEWREGSV